MADLSRKPRDHLLIVVFIVSVALLLRFALAAFTYGAGLIDVERYEVVGRTVLDGGTAYDLDAEYYPYLPAWSYIEAGAVWAADQSGLSFDFVIKIPIIAADVLIAAWIYVILIHLNSAPRTAAAWALFYAANPVSIIVAAGHGQFDALPILFTLIAYHLLLVERYPLAGLMIGIGILIKLYPAAFLPFMLVYLYPRAPRRTVIAFAGFAILPSLLSIAPFVAVGEWKAVTRSIMYPMFGGAYNFGLGKLLPDVDENHVSFVFIISLLTKMAFVVLYLVTLLQFMKGRRSLVVVIVRIMLIFYVFSPTLSAQYLGWVLPFACILRRRFSLLYTFLAAAAMIFFYLFMYPAALVGTRTISASLHDAAANGYPVLNAMFWIAVAGWFVAESVPQPPPVLSARRAIRSQ